MEIKLGLGRWVIVLYVKKARIGTVLCVEIGHVIIRVILVKNLLST